MYEHVRTLTKLMGRVVSRSTWVPQMVRTPMTLRWYSATRITNDVSRMQDLIDEGIIDQFLSSTKKKEYEEQQAAGVDSDSTASSTRPSASATFNNTSVSNTINLSSNDDVSRMADLIDPDLVDNFLSSSQKIYEVEAGLSDTLGTSATNATGLTTTLTAMDSDVNKDATMSILNEVRELRMEIAQLRQAVEKLHPTTTEDNDQR